MGGAGVRRTILVRVGLLALAVLAVAWYIVGEVQLHAQTQAATLIPDRTKMPPSQLTRVLHLLDRAATLNPDRAIDVLRGEAYVHSDQSHAAEGLMKRVVREEPLNINAWILLWIAASPTDPATAHSALAKQHELAPPVPAAP
jgi:predicted Zn-dependent protease